MVTRVRWDPAKHPRGPVGRFISTTARPPRVRRGAAITTDHAAEASSYYSTAEQDAISSYISGSDTLNNSLRGRGDYTPPYALAPNRNELTANLDRAIDRFPIPEPVRVYRGVDGQYLEAESLRPGDQILDPGYLSTSTRPSNFEDYGDTLLEIRLPAGTRVAPVLEDLDDPFLDEWSAAASEQEVIVGRGSVLQVESVRGRTIRAFLVGYLDREV